MDERRPGEKLNVDYEDEVATRRRMMAGFVVALHHPNHSARSLEGPQLEEIALEVHSKSD
jgi:hypothetical protein